MCIHVNPNHYTHMQSFLMYITSKGASFISILVFFIILLLEFNILIALLCPTHQYY